MSESDPTATPSADASPQPASGSADQSRVTALREELKGIDAKLDGPSLDLQTKMEMKSRKQLLERQIRDIEKKGS